MKKRFESEFTPPLVKPQVATLQLFNVQRDNSLLCHFKLTSPLTSCTAFLSLPFPNPKPSSNHEN